MIFVWGEYHWWPKRIAFRNDYCLSCAAERRSIRIRAFLVLHVFGIPILPAGFYKNWKCTVCSRDPHVNPEPWRLFKWLGLYTLIVFACLLWGVPDLVPGSRFVLIGSLAGATLMSVHLLLTRKDPFLQERLAAIPPATDIICPFCGTPMNGGSQWSCPACGVVRC